MADKIKRTLDEGREHTANTQDGAISDDELEAVAGGIQQGGNDMEKPVSESRTGVGGNHADRGRR